MKGACVSTALSMQNIAMGVFGGDFGFLNVVSGHISPFKQGFDIDPYETPQPDTQPRSRMRNIQMEIRSEQ